MVREAVAHAALVLEGAQAAAWAEYGTPEELPNIHHRKQYEEGAVPPGDYRITCSTSTSGTGDPGSPRSRCAVRSI